MVAAFAAVAATASGHCTAAEWSAAPSFGVSVVDETNPGLAAVSAQERQALVANLQLDLQRRSEISTLELSSTASRRQYGEGSGLNRSDVGSELSFRHSVTERFSWSAMATARRDTTRTSELGTTGETQDAYRHEAIGFQFQPQWQVRERWAFQTRLQWQSDRYPSAAAGLVDYEYLSAGAVGSWQISPQDSLGIVAHAGRTRVALATQRISDQSVSLEYTRTINERWQLRVAGGPALATGQGSTQHGENFSLDLTRDAQYGAVSLLVDRAIAPSGRGYLTRRDSMALQLRRELGSHLTGSLTGRYLRSRNVVGALDFVFDDIRYHRIDAGLSWSFSPQWSTEFHAGHAGQRQRANGTDASGFDAGLGLRWTGKNHVF